MRIEECRQSGKVENQVSKSTYGEAGVANEILENEAKSCLAIA